MKALLCKLLGAGCIASCCALPLPAAAQQAEDPTYVIPIEGMIERGLLYAIRRGLKEAEANDAGALILDMDTPGGKLDATEEIVQLLLELPMPTYTFVDPRAISGGALIALATDEIYMAPAALIGDAMPIMMSPVPMGGAQEVPEGLREKIMSPTIALARSAAQAKGHDTKLVEAMIRPEFEYKIGDEVISPAGRLLTLTSVDACRLVGEGDERRPLLAKGTVKSLDELLETIGRAGKPIVTVQIQTAEKIARVIESVPVSGLLLALGLLGIYIEFKTPGFGLPGIGGILCLAVWFWGHHIAGLAGMGELLLFAAGVALLLIEIFAIPGFGFVGISGITLMVIALLMAMVENPPAAPWYAPPSEGQISDSIKAFALALVLTFAAGAVLTRFLPQTSAFKRIALAADVGRQGGYEAAKSAADMVGTRGVAATPLHPAGIGDFGDKRVNVVARGEFIDKGTPILVAEVHGNRIVVEGCEV